MDWCLEVVTSAVGVNRKDGEEDRNGFLAEDGRGWFEKLEALVENVGLRKRLGEAGRRKVAAEYTVEQGLAKWLEILEKSSRHSEQPAQQIAETVAVQG